MRLAGKRLYKDILLANYSLGRTGITKRSFSRQTLPLTSIEVGKMRPFYSLFILTSWNPIGTALLSFKQCSKRMIHSHSPRVFKSAFLSEEPETTNRNFITNLIEDDIKENKVSQTEVLLRLFLNMVFWIYWRPTALHNACAVLRQYFDCNENFNNWFLSHGAPLTLPAPASKHILWQLKLNALTHYLLTYISCVFER